MSDYLDEPFSIKEEMKQPTNEYYNQELHKNAIDPFPSVSRESRNNQSALIQNLSAR